MGEPLLQPLELPEGDLTPAWCAAAAQALDAASRAGPASLKAVLPGEVASRLFDRCQALLHAEPTLLEVGGCRRRSCRCRRAAKCRPGEALPPPSVALWPAPACEHVQACHALLHIQPAA